MDSKEGEKKRIEWGGTTRDYILFPAEEKKRKKEGEFFGCGFYSTVRSRTVWYGMVRIDHDGSGYLFLDRRDSR